MLDTEAQTLFAGLRPLAALPLAFLASCAVEETPALAIEPTDLRTELVACRARIGSEHQATHIVHTAPQGLALNDLSARVGIETGVRIHPDGNRLVFALERRKDQPSSREIYTWSVDRSEPEVRLTGNNWVDEGPCWSPDGTSILFASGPGIDRNLWRMDIDGQNLQQVTAGGDDRNPDWHPNGVVFTRTDRTTQPSSRIFLTDAAGTQPIPLTDGRGLGDSEPAWSPDGKSIIFTRQFTADRRSLMHLTLGQTEPTELSDSEGIDRFPRWSPHGDGILVARSRPAAGLDGLRLYNVAADGSDPLLVFPDRRFAYLGFDTSPAMGTRDSNRLFAHRNLDTAGIDLVGFASQGNLNSVRAEDGSVLGVASVISNAREIAALLLTLDLEVVDPTRIAAIRIQVTAALTRSDPDSYLRIALGNVPEDRFDTVVELAPTNNDLGTYSFATSSLAHVDRDGRIRLEVIGDLSSGAQAELLVDHIAVGVRLHPTQR